MGLPKQPCMLETGLVSGVRGIYAAKHSLGRTAAGSRVSCSRHRRAPPMAAVPPGPGGSVPAPQDVSTQGCGAEGGSHTCLVRGLM